MAMAGLQSMGPSRKQSCPTLVLSRVRRETTIKSPSMPFRGKGLELTHPPIAQLGDELKEFSTPKHHAEARARTGRRGSSLKVDLENVTKEVFR